MAPLEIRRRTEDDLGALVDIARRVHEIDNYPIYLPDGDFARFITEPPPVEAWVAVAAGAIVGHVVLNSATTDTVMELVDGVDDDRTAIYVSRLFVDPLARRTGAGRALLDHARQTALSLGFLPALDVVDGPTTAAAVELYQSSGWSEIGSVSFDLVGTEITERVFISA